MVNPALNDVLGRTALPGPERGVPGGDLAEVDLVRRASLGVLLLLVVEELGDVGAAADEAEDAEVEQRVQLIDDLAAQRRLEIRGGRDQYLLACKVAQAGGEATLPLQHFRINSRKCRSKK